MNKLKLTKFTVEGPLTPSERTRYEALKKSIIDHIDIAHSALMRVAQDLKVMRDERLYRQEASTFEEWCQKVIGKQRDYIYKLIASGDTLDTLMREGVPGSELPNSERLCRELARYPGPDMKKIWNRAKELALVAGKKQPDTMTVREAAVQIEGTPKAKERAAKEIIYKVEGYGRGLKISISWVEMTEREVKRLKKAFAHLIAIATTHLQQAPAEGADPEQKSSAGVDDRPSAET